jgi:hypothetical protein
MFLRNLTFILIGMFCLIQNHNAIATCAAVLRDGDFEMQRSNVVSTPWVAEGRAGIDINRRLSFSGRNNAWVRQNTGWNAIRQTIRLYAGQTYTLKGFIRSSDNIRSGYFGFRDVNQHPVAEIQFGPLPAYQELRVQFSPESTGTFNVFAGFWAPNQDAWIQIDNVRVEFPCEGSGDACWAREFLALNFCNVVPSDSPRCPPGSISVRAYRFLILDYPNARQNFTYACVSRRHDDPGGLQNCTDAYGSTIDDGDVGTINRACLDAEFTD